VRPHGVEQVVAGATRQMTPRKSSQRRPLGSVNPESALEILVLAFQSERLPVGPLALDVPRQLSQYRGINEKTWRGTVSEVTGDVGIGRPKASSFESQQRFLRVSCFGVSGLFSHTHEEWFIAKIWMVWRRGPQPGMKAGG